MLLNCLAKFSLPTFRSLGVVSVLAAVLAAGACGKNSATQNSPPASASASQPTNAAQMPAGGAADVGEIQRSVIRWIVLHHARPANFEQFAASADVKIPPPPPGKKYVLASDMHVKLVDQ